MLSMVSPTHAFVYLQLFSYVLKSPEYKPEYKHDAQASEPLPGNKTHSLACASCLYVLIRSIL